MEIINRFSSRRQSLDKAFLSEKLRYAKSYIRIAGYFRSSIFELVGEEISNIPDVRIICNSELDISDVIVSRAVRESAIMEHWNNVSVEVESLLHRDRYKRLYELLTKGNVQIRVVPKSACFIHGKAGVIETTEGKSAFLGSINETKNAFSGNYEILWEDTSAEGVAWVEEEFEALWKESFPLPDAIIEEIKRVADRVEISFEDIEDKEILGAALAEAPIYRNGEQLQPWQRSFLTLFMEYREVFGKVRLILADEVGLGKTLSLAASAVVSSLLNDGPVLILCPSTLLFQWQVELKDRLGVPSVVWLSNRKMWIDPNGHIIKTNGLEDIVNCPYQIAIVSTGLIVRESQECNLLLEKKYGTVILDEAHKARRSSPLEKGGEPNNLLGFMIKMGTRTKNLLLGTATPIQTQVNDLWDLMKIINSGADFVLGHEYVSRWFNWEKSSSIMKGLKPSDGREAWDLLRNPFPPKKENALVSSLRQQLGIKDQVFSCERSFGDLDYFQQEDVKQTLNNKFFVNYNPIVRNTVFRRRATLEEQGLLERVGVEVHPQKANVNIMYKGQSFIGQALMTNHPFILAYTAAETFTHLLRKRVVAAGFMKSLLLQRICSSFSSGKATAERILNKDIFEDEDMNDSIKDTFTILTLEEADCLKIIVKELSRPEARDPKFEAVRYFLTEHYVEGKTWLEHGCIIFSQYFDTVKWIASELAKYLKNEPVAVYAGIGKSGVFYQNNFNVIGREDIKNAVKRREIRLVVATDAACEGLNLQTLGTLINVDLPWNPAKLEQRLGRIKRFGQTRKQVDILNLIYHDTQDENIYNVVSQRLKDKYDIFGGLPDTIEDDWIENVKQLEEMVNKYVHLQEQARNVFELRYQTNIMPEENRWELCNRVLSRSDIIKKMSEPW